MSPALGSRLGPHSVLQEFDLIHAGHALVGKKQSNAVIPHPQLL